MQRSLQSRNSSIAFLIGLVLLACMAAFCAPAASAAAPARSYIVVLKDDVAHPANVAHRHEENRGADVDHIYGVAIKGYSAELTPGELHAIRQDPNVDYVERDGAIHPKSQVTGTQVRRVFANQNPQLDIDGVNDAPINVDIAILDTGIAAHSDLNIAGRVDCVGHGGACVPGVSTDDLSGHGTHVAGDAAAIDNGIGVVGMAPGARLWSVKVIAGMGPIGPDEIGNGPTPYQSGNAQMSDAIAGINWVTANSSVIEVGNMSFDCTTDQGGCAHTALAQAIASSVNSGVVWIAAAGYESDPVNGSFKSYPALLPDVITVSAMADYDGLPGSLSSPSVCSAEKNWPQHDDRLSVGGGIDLGGFGSNFGPEVDITAPGTCILSTYKEGTYSIMSGSSMASGLVAGAAADIAANYNPNNRTDVEKIRAALLGAGNYDWEDLQLKGDNLVSPDGYKEPLLALPSTPLTPAPAVTPVSTVGVSEESATLQATVNPQGTDARYKFECGTTTAYGSSTPETYVPVSSSPVAASAVVNLEPDSTYHCRLWAKNSGGTTYSPDYAFSTPSEVVPSPYIVPSTKEFLVFGRVNQELYGFIKSSTGVWTDYDVSAKVSGVPKITGTTVPVEPKSGELLVFAAVNNELYGFIRSSTGVWTDWDVSAQVPGVPKIEGTPSVIEPNPGEFLVFARVNGELYGFIRSSTGVWTDYDVSAESGGGKIKGSPAAIEPVNNELLVFARNENNELIGFIRNPTTGVWTRHNVTNEVAAHQRLFSAPVPVVVNGNEFLVFGRTTDNEVVGFIRNPTTGVWTSHNVSFESGSSALKLRGRPSIIEPKAGELLSFSRSYQNDLIAHIRSATGTWTVFNVTAETPGNPKIKASPIAIQEKAGELLVFARNASNELVAFIRSPTGVWQVWSVSGHVSGIPKVE
jgi:Subtilase family/Peptidase inhibitor I9